MKTLHLTISKVDGPVFEGEVLSVTVPGTEGEMTLLPEHSALVSLLKKGNIVVRPMEGDEKGFAVEHGTVEVSGNQATILI
ncbi:F0F1 ATP synthase subunit epsilon [Candidatus Kaiserbacteria bacterium]|nr:F0F1 ATP synthase subunit epsilon [Candidatus Kaiserbacteria bacterium]